MRWSTITHGGLGGRAQLHCHHGCLVTGGGGLFVLRNMFGLKRSQYFLYLRYIPE
jgi:hypothetical protein